MSGFTSSSHLRKAALLECSMTERNSEFHVASSRRVGILFSGDTFKSGGCVTRVQGARKVRSSSAAWHCRTRASDHHMAWLSGKSLKLSLIPALVETSCSRHVRAADKVVGGKAHKPSNSFISSLAWRIAGFVRLGS